MKKVKQTISQICRLIVFSVLIMTLVCGGSGVTLLAEEVSTQSAQTDDGAKETTETANAETGKNTGDDTTNTKSANGETENKKTTGDADDTKIKESTDNVDDTEKSTETETETEDTESTQDTEDLSSKVSYKISLTVPDGYTPVIWIDGIEYATTVSADGRTAAVDLTTSTAAADTATASTTSSSTATGKTDAKVAQMYRYNANGSMIGLYVWLLSYDGTSYTATAAPELENILGYTGISIRSSGNAGIRYTAYMPTDKKTSLLSDAGLSDHQYKMAKRGTLLMAEGNYDKYKKFILPGSDGWESTLQGKILESISYGYNANNQFIYQNRSSDSVKETFTTILTNQKVKYYRQNLKFRSYVTLKDKDGNEFTVYSGISTKNIVDVAKKIMDLYGGSGEGKLYAEGTAEYIYLDKVIADGDNSYTINYDLQGGTVGDGDEGSALQTAYTREFQSVTIPDPTKTGYFFTGWTIDTTDANTLAGITKSGSTTTIDVASLASTESCRNLKFTANWSEADAKAYDYNRMLSCEAASGQKITITATIPYYVKSYDNQYYLVAVNQNTNAVEYAVAKTDRTTDTLSYTLELKPQGDAHYNQCQTLEGTWIRAFMNKYAIAVKTDANNYAVISDAKYVSNPEALAKSDSFTKGTTKKGVQSADYIVSASDPYKTEGVNDLGVGQVFLNLYASDVLNGTAAYEYNGKYYYFNTLDAYKATLRALNYNGISATIQVMLDGKATAMIHSKCRGTTSASLYSWEDTNREGREMIEAMFCYLGEALADGSTPEDQRFASNWILGNEVNSYGAYQAKGSMSDAEFFQSYAETYRAFYNAIKATNSASNIYICLDQHWTTAYSGGGYGSKAFLDTFKAYMDTYDATVDWNVALHPYSYPMTKNDFWNCDSSYVNDSVNSPYLTMKNIGMATSYISANMKNSGGTDKHILLSEQGYSYHVGADDASVGKTQATALVYSYYIAACNPMIDGFMMRSTVDDTATETKLGLYFGLCDSALAKKESYEAYRDCDSKTKAQGYSYYTVVNASAAGWSELVPGYDEAMMYPRQ